MHNRLEPWPDEDQVDGDVSILRRYHHRYMQRDYWYAAMVKEGTATKKEVQKLLRCVVGRWSGTCGS